MARFKRDEFYIDPVVFYDEMVKRTNEIDEVILSQGLSIGDNRRESLKLLRKKGFKLPKASDYIGESILKISQRLLRHQWFSGYTQQWKEDMMGDGLENALRYLDNFNPEKSKNPFAYYTQIIWFAFRRRIIKEKDQTYIKAKLIEASGFDLSVIDSHDDTSYKSNAKRYMRDTIGDIIAQREKVKPTKEVVDDDELVIEDLPDEILSELENEIVGVIVEKKKKGRKPIVKKETKLSNLLGK